MKFFNKIFQTIQIYIAHPSPALGAALARTVYTTGSRWLYNALAAPHAERYQLSGLSWEMKLFANRFV